MTTEINLTDPEKPTTDRPDLVTKSIKKGLIIVHTGNGKGKSSSAFGMVFRSAAHGFRVGIVQFIKGSWKTGEQKLPEIFPGLVDMHIMGEGFTWDTKSRARDVETAMKAWNKAKEMIESGVYRLIVLDEINYAMGYEFIPVAEVVETLKKKDPMLHVILTGRDAKPELIEVADLVTEMMEIKHPYKTQGIKAQQGIEF